MFFKALLSALLFATPLAAQSPVAPDCTVDGRLADRAGLRLDLVYRCQAERPISFRLTDERARPYLSDLRLEQGDGWSQARYRFDVSGFARTVDSTSVAVLRGASALLTLGGWLLEPQGYDRLPAIDIRMATDDPGLRFATGLPGLGGAWRLAGTPVRYAGFTAFGRFAYRALEVAAPGSLRPGQPPRRGILRLAILDGVGQAAIADLVAWVEGTVQAQSNYWHGFTALHGLVALVPVDTQRSVGFGRAENGGGVSVMVEVGKHADRHRLFDDWVLVHELIHTGMPYIRGRGSWLMEGAATYVEPIIRARAGWKTEEEVWREWVEDMPQGVPAFSRGLASASGREKYWAGALFMLLADLDIRRDSGGAKGLEDCLGGVLWNGLDGTRSAGVVDYAAACDRVTGTRAMSTLVERHYRKAEQVDLDRLWRELGVAKVAGRIVLDDAAPAARWRRLIVPGTHPARHVKLPWES